MKKAKKLLGFTLIELLIVIAIIGVLAVAFLPTLLEAPAKGRDTSRIADLQKIQKVLVNANLEGGQYPDSANDFTITNQLDGFISSFGGKVPSDPTEGQKYYYKKGVGDYSFALWAKMEVAGNANAKCDQADDGLLVTPVAADDPDNICYAIFTQ